MFDFIAKPCVWLMNLIYSVIPNYGVAIIYHNSGQDSAVAAGNEELQVHARNEKASAVDAGDS